MARDIPSPCCGVFNVKIKSKVDVSKENPLSFSCHCGICGAQYGDSAESRSEALYNYDIKCLDVWKQNPNGLRDWMKNKPHGKDEVAKRLAISITLKKHFNL